MTEQRVRATLPELDISSDNVLRLWDDGSALRSTQSDRADYYDGDQAILDEDEERSDGLTRNLVVTNWVRYIADQHVGFITAQPFNYTAPEGVEKTEKEAVKGLTDLFQSLQIDGIDSTHLRQALLYGYSVEVHSYNDAGVQITEYDPREWVIVYDEMDQVRAGIHRCAQAKGTVYEDALLADDLIVFTVYTSVHKTVYHQTKGDKGAAVLTEEVVETHHYGEVPVVVFQITSDRSSFISDALISQQDVFNKTRSAMADDIQYNVDALLVLSGYEPDALFEKDEDGKTYYQKIRENRLLPLNKEGEAKFLVRDVGHEVIIADLHEARDAIHMMGRIADIAMIVGATGQTSGIALKLKLKPQIEQAELFMKYLTRGLRRRLDLITTVWSTANQGAGKLEGIDISYTLNIPVNETELWEAVGSLEPFLTLESILKLIPSIDDPEAEAEAKRTEVEEATERALETMVAREEVSGVNAEDNQNEQGDLRDG